MYIRRWNTKMILMVVCGCLALYTFFTSGYHKYQIDGFIKNAKPEEVWKFMADFSKMPLMNPTILNFEIVSDSGNIHDWRYSVLYTERLSHWPYWLNSAKADYIVKKSLPDVIPPIYTVLSRHQTCFFKGIYCLHAESEFKFTPVDIGTYCMESIQYQCPPFFSRFCRRELEYQRKAVMNNLTIIFSKRQSTI